jgi:single-stranded-DNA-specific exonuclease
MAHAVWKLDGTTIVDKRDLVYDLLDARGIDNPDEFLRITKRKFHNPYKMKNMKLAVVRIIEAIQKGHKIGIFGDYDADGVSSTTTWVLVLKELGADVIYFIPDRFIDGYGVNKRGLDYFKEEDVELVITCDTGITAIEQVHYCKSIGMDIIVTDHHEPQEYDAYKPDVRKKGKQVKEFLIPDCITVNPKRPDCRYPFKGLAGVGVTFKVLCAVCDKIHPAGKAGAYQYMDIVALGTFADMMDIIDENRVIGKLGIDMMNKTSNRGLYQLFRANELQKITSQDVGWTIAPCINAAGRIVSAEEAVEMLISDNKLDAYRCAQSLVEINKQRKEITKNYVSNIIKTIEAEQELNPQSIIVHYHPGIPEGIVGLVASRVMNHFYKPSIILTDADEDGVYKGSGRSIKGFNLFTSLMKYTDIMEGFGGHSAACGLSLKKEAYEVLKEHLELLADATLSPDQLQPKVYIDAIVKGNILDLDFVEEMSKLEPFGSGNDKPLFMMEDVRVIKSKPVGDEKNHLWALMSQGGKTFSTIGFFLWEKYEAIGEPKNIDVAFFPDINEWPKASGKFSVQLKIEDVRKTEAKKKKKYSKR